VLATARRVRYRANRAARSLVTGAGKTFALVVPDLTRPAYATLAQEAGRRARAGGHLLAVADWAGDPAGEPRLCADLAGRADGLLLCSPGFDDEEGAALAEASPVVLLHRRIGSLPAVLADERTAVNLAIDHVRELGHHAIAFLYGPDVPEATRRHARTIAARYRARPVHLTATQADFDTGRALAGEVASSGRTAVVVFGSNLALGLIAGLREAGIDVPDEVSVVAVGDEAGGRPVRSILTTVAPPAGEMARAAMDLMLMTAGRDGHAATLRTIRFEPRLETRTSTAPPPRRG